MKPHSIAGVNKLPEAEKRDLYARFIPQQLLDEFGIPKDFLDAEDRSLLEIRARPGSTSVILDLRHRFDAVDPLLYAHLTDTMNGQIHVLLYIVNDPDSPRFDVDRMPDGTPTEFGTALRNLPAETAAMQAGLAPGQVRSGMRILKHSIDHFEAFVTSLGHDIYFIEPLYYHNAIIFEGYGFAYQQGRRLMERIQAGFSEGGEFLDKLDGSTAFRPPEAHASIRGRSWAIHDGILGNPYANVTMFKEVGDNAGIHTFPNARW
jgi:hypothetical protein